MARDVPCTVHDSGSAGPGGPSSPELSQRRTRGSSVDPLPGFRLAYASGPA